uniref:DNA methylase N-4/N-6 domain-containing protein n=1 Tax=viral metagenome TaxID=1070528 RepID=A0A6C0JW10_9ZZZZ
MDYTKKTSKELKAMCKERKIKGYSNLNKDKLLKLLKVENKEYKKDLIQPDITLCPSTLRQEIIHGDTIDILPTLPSDSAQIIIADPPYNIGKDFGNDSDKQPMKEYLIWCDAWIKECIRILKPNGTMFIYGFSEILALILSRVPYEINRRWILWHYTNKNVPSLNFWQRSHESIIVLWKTDKVFHRNDVREPYTDGFLNGAAGKQRKATKGRFSKGEKTTTYTAHKDGALPRDVIKFPALAGGAGMNERVNHPTQKPLALCDKLIRSCMQPVDKGYVLVPFAGSGSECLSAKNLNMPFIGIELNPEYITLIHQRLEGKKQTEEVPHPCQSDTTIL